MYYEGLADDLTDDVTNQTRLSFFTRIIICAYSQFLHRPVDPYNNLGLILKLVTNLQEIVYNHLQFVHR